MKRYFVLDSIRGVTLLSMVLYHAAWDLVYLFHQNFTWYQSDTGYVWQQSICWTFIMLSGFVWSLGRKKLKRGISVWMSGMLITVITAITMPENYVIFGILTLIGTCMLLMIFLDRLFRKWNSTAGFIVSFLLFVLFRNVNRGYLGFEAWNIIKLPDFLYQNLLTAYLGFPEQSFCSADYFSLLPWMFLFIAGYFLYHMLEERKLLKHLEHRNNIPGIGWLGKHSLEIYLLHQPLLFLGLNLCF